MLLVINASTYTNDINKQPSRLVEPQTTRGCVLWIQQLEGLVHMPYDNSLSCVLLRHQSTADFPFIDEKE